MKVAKVAEGGESSLCDTFISVTYVDNLCLFEPGFVFIFLEHFYNIPYNRCVTGCLGIY